MFPNSCDNLSSRWKNSSQTPNLLPIFVQVYPLGAYELVDIYPMSPRKSDFYQQVLKVLPIFPPQCMLQRTIFTGRGRDREGSMFAQYMAITHSTKLDKAQGLSWRLPFSTYVLPEALGTMTSLSGMFTKFRSFCPISLIFLTYVLLSYFVRLHCANIHIHLPSFSFLMT